METRVQRVGGMLQKFPPAHRAAYLAREMQGLVRRPHQIRRYFANERDFAGLQIGAGHHHLDGWLTTDLEPLDLQVVYMDATKPCLLMRECSIVLSPSILLSTLHTRAR
jgi:hypothetical protein